MPARDHVDCLGLGICPLDILFEVDRFPGPGTKINALNLTIQGGGPVPNVLIGLRRLGHTGAFITAMAHDMVGRQGVEELARDKIDTRFVVWKNTGYSGAASGFIERGSGRRTLVFSRSVELKPRDILLSALPRPRVIHLDGRDLDACIKLARWGRRIGVPVCFDIGSVRNDVSPIFPWIDHLVVADAFALPFTRTRTARRAIIKLADRCPGTIVVTEGTRGSLGYESGSFVRGKAFKTRNVDTTGAGDAFHTGYIYGLLHGHDIPRRLEFGAAVAALKCTKMGARAGLPTLAQVRTFMKGKPRTYA
jgi:sugar/nucleoside kinase (ribokinase family)